MRGNDDRGHCPLQANCFKMTLGKFLPVIGQHNRSGRSFWALVLGVNPSANPMGVSVASMVQIPRPRHLRWVIGLVGILLVESIARPRLDVVQPAIATLPVLHRIAVGQFYPGIAPAIAVDELATRAYVGINGMRPGAGYVGFLDSRSGILAHMAALPFAVDHIAVAAHPVRVVAATQGGTRVSVLDGRTGALVRTVPAPPSVEVTALAIGDAQGRAYAVGNSPCQASAQKCMTAVQEIDLRTGMRMRTIVLYDPQPIVWSAAVVDNQARTLILVGRDIGDFRSDHAALDVVALTDGHLIHHSVLPYDVEGAAQDSQVALDQTTGRAFVVVAPAPYAAPPTRPGAILTTSSMIILDTRTGRVEPIVRLGAGSAQVAIDERDGRVFATTYGPTRLLFVSAQDRRQPARRRLVTKVTGDGALYMLDAHDGRVLRIVPMGMATTALAVDARQQRAYVASAGAMTGMGAYAGPGMVQIVDTMTMAVLQRARVDLDPLHLVLDSRARRLFVATVGPYQADMLGAGYVSVLDTTHQ